MTIPNENLNDLASQWREAKKAEDQANAQRVALEQQLIKTLEFTKPEGSQSVKTDTFKVTLTAKLNKKLDIPHWLSIKERIPDALRAVVKEKPTIDYKLDDKGLKYLENNEPDIYTLLCEAITVTPAKTAVKVEVL